jgi:hypothetical protein
MPSTSQGKSVTEGIPPDTDALRRNSSCESIADAIIPRIRRSEETQTPLDLGVRKLGGGAYNDVFLIPSVRSPPFKILIDFTIHST